jgi:nitrogen fixation/metabolism regulation signal transduction histidine kinase
LRPFSASSCPVAIADQLLDAFRQFARLRLAAIEDGHLVTTTQRILHLVRPSESRAAENQDVHRFRLILRARRAAGEQAETDRASCHG